VISATAEKGNVFTAKNPEGEPVLSEISESQSVDVAVSESVFPESVVSKYVSDAREKVVTHACQQQASLPASENNEPSVECGQPMEVDEFRGNTKDVNNEDEDTSTSPFGNDDMLMEECQCGFYHNETLAMEHMCTEGHYGFQGWLALQTRNVCDWCSDKHSVSDMESFSLFSGSGGFPAVSDGDFHFSPRKYRRHLDRCVSVRSAFFMVSDTQCLNYKHLYFGRNLAFDEDHTSQIHPPLTVKDPQGRRLSGLVLFMFCKTPEHGTAVPWSLLHGDGRTHTDRAGVGNGAAHPTSTIPTTMDPSYFPKTRDCVDWFNLTLYDVVRATSLYSPKLDHVPTGSHSHHFSKVVGVDQEDTVPSFGTFIWDMDLSYVTAYQTITHFWDLRKQKKRAKVPARQLFYDQLPDRTRWSELKSAGSIAPAALLTMPSEERRRYLREKWLEPHFDLRLEVPVTHEGNTRDILAKPQRFKISQEPVPFGDYTDVWTRPEHLNSVLLNPYVRKLYNFSCGSHIFPTTYRGGKNGDFFLRNYLRDGLILNPPYSRPTIDRVIAKLVRHAYNFAKTFAVILPYKPNLNWYKLLTALRTPVLFLETPLKFRRGLGEKVLTFAPFNTIIALIGAVHEGSHIVINNDHDGRPLNFKYFAEMRKICFNGSVNSEHAKVTPRGFNHWSKILERIMQAAEIVDNTTSTADISNDFDFDELKKYNYFLQHVADDIDATNSHLWSIYLNPFIKDHAAWEKIADKHRSIFTRKSGNSFLESFLREPRERFAKCRCNICKSLGHTATMCPGRVPKSHELGLKALLDKTLYMFIVSVKPNSDNRFDFFQNPTSFWLSAKKALQLEAKFWVRWKKFAQEHALEQPQAVMHDIEFAKGRKALGFNWALGATTQELILDAFGATLPLVDPPPPCEFVEKLHTQTGHPVYTEIDPQLQAEDRAELERRTQYIVPRRYIKYILPRFVVVNNDTTKRSINDCRFLGPYTARNSFRLDTPISLQVLSGDDILLSIDGKSAYKQRTLAWGYRNQIGFRTVVDGKVCYVAIATPPFGLHNAGHIYQKCLEKKISRISGKKFWLEYIDDVLIRLGTRNLDHQELQWIGSAFLWLITKSGEILNNKFHVFQNIVTMLGVKYNLSTNRFAPKLGSFYKLGYQLLRLLREPQVSVGDIQSLCGKLQWLCPGTSIGPVLRPCYKFISLLCQRRNLRTKRDFQKLKDIRVDWNVALHSTVLEGLTVALEQYATFRQPNVFARGRLLCIVVDSNPQVAGGYMFFKQRNLYFSKISEPKLVTALTLSQVPPQYIRTMGYQKILHSHRWEGLGLLQYLKKHWKIIRELARDSDRILIFGDNLGLMANLTTGKQKFFLTSHEQHAVSRLLDSLQTPYHFTWLRRNTAIIKFADALGRTNDFSIKMTLLVKLEEFFGCKLVKSDVLDTPLQLPQLFPQFLIQKIKEQPGTKLVILPPRAQRQQIIVCCKALARLGIRVVLGAPKTGPRHFQMWMRRGEYFEVPKVTSQFFTGKNILHKPAHNTPYIFFQVEPGGDNPFIV